MTPKKKLIEVALPLAAINKGSVREKSIRHGQPSTSPQASRPQVIRHKKAQDNPEQAATPKTA